MTNRALIIASAIVGTSILGSALIVRQLPPSHNDLVTTPDPANTRQVLIDQFIEEVRTKTPRLEHNQAIREIDVASITLSPDGAVLQIVPRIFWTKQDTPTEYPCTLNSDGFGGFAGRYSPMSDNRKMLNIRLAGI